MLKSSSLCHGRPSGVCSLHSPQGLWEPGWHLKRQASLVTSHHAPPQGVPFFVETDTAKPQSGFNRLQQSLPRFLGWTSWDLGHGHLLPKSKTDTDKGFATKRKIPLFVKDFAIVSQFRSVLFHLAYILKSPRGVFINTNAQIYSKFFV